MSTNCVTAAPMPGVTVEMTGGFVNSTDALGDLVSDFSAAPGSYTVTASKPFAASGPGATAPAVVVDGATTSVNLCLTGTAFLESSGHALVAENCTAPNGAPDPGEGLVASCA